MKWFKKAKYKKQTTRKKKSGVSYQKSYEEMMKKINDVFDGEIQDTDFKSFDEKMKNHETFNL